MIYRQKNDYLKAAGGPLQESPVVQVAMGHVNKMNANSSQWRNMWSQVKKFFYPDLNVTYQLGTGGELRSNEVSTSKPNVFLMKLVSFYFVSLFPENLWLSHVVRGPGGKEIPKGKLSPVFLRHLDELQEVCIRQMERGGFFQEVLQYLAHFVMLGNAAMKVSGNLKGELVYRDVAVDGLNIQRDSNGEVWGFSWMETVDRWQILRDYGEGAMNVFTDMSPVSLNGYQPLPHNRWAGTSPEGGGMSMGGATGQGVGTATGTSKSQTEELIYLHIPNHPSTGIPGAGAVNSEMEYLTYVIANRTKRLLDVWVHTGPMFGVSTDIRVMGENYARGMGGRLLPDAFTLNEHRQAVLQGRGVMMRSPVVFAGDKPAGFKGPLKPFQILHVPDNATKVTALFGAQMAQQNKQATQMEDVELLSFRDSMGINDVQVELADRMTAYEFRMRQDNNHSFFHPIGQQIYRGIRHIIKATQDYVYLTGMMEPPPPEMMLSGLDFDIELRSVFSFGAKEKGNNLIRALAPFAEVANQQPELLDWVDFEAALRQNMSQYHVADLIKSSDKVQSDRQARARIAGMEKGGSGAVDDPVAKGLNRAEEEAAAEGAEATGQQQIVSR